MKQVKVLAGAVSTALLMTACGGGGTLPPSISNNVTPDGQIELAPGRGMTANADSSATRHQVENMRWHAERLDGTGGDPLVLANAECEALTATYENSRGSGQCSTTIVVPENATPGLWKITNTATNSNGENYADSFNVRVVEKPYTGFSLFVPQVPIVHSLGDIVTVNAHVSTPTTLGPSPNVRYSWEQVSGTPVSMAGSDSRTISIAPTLPGEYAFKVRAEVTIGGVLDVQEKTTVVLVRDMMQDRFVLSAGDAQIVHPDQVVTMAGYLIGNEELFLPSVTFRWQQISGPQVLLSNATAMNASFIPRETGEYNFELSARTSSYGQEFTETAQTVVLVVDQEEEVPDGPPPPPDTSSFSVSASGGTGGLGEIIALSSTATFPEDTAVTNVTRSWTQIGGPTTSIMNANSAQASFIPTEAGQYAFMITVNARINGEEHSRSNTVVVTVAAPEQPPGPDLSGFQVSTAPAPVAAQINTQVSIPSTFTTPTGAAATNVRYQWTQIGGPTAQIANANSHTMTYVPDSPGQYSFLVTVSANMAGQEMTRTNTAVVIVEDPVVGHPIVSAGNAQAIDASLGAPVMLSGTVTYPPGRTVTETPTYLWTQVAGPGTIIYNGSTLNASVLLQTPGTYAFTLTVTGEIDGVPFTRTANTAVLVRDVPLAP